MNQITESHMTDGRVFKNTALETIGKKHAIKGAHAKLDNTDMAEFYEMKCRRELEQRGLMAAAHRFFP